MNKHKKAQMSFQVIMIILAVIGLGLGIYYYTDIFHNVKLEKGCGAYAASFCQAGTTCPEGTIHLAGSDINCKKETNPNYVCCGGEKPE